MKQILARTQQRLAKAGADDLDPGQIEAIILDYFRNHPNPNDPDVHELAGRLGMEPEILEKHIYRAFTKFIQHCAG